MAIEDFMAVYRQTWQHVLEGTQDVSDLCAFYYIPSMMLDQNGDMIACSTPDELQRFLTARLTHLRAFPGPLNVVVNGVQVVPQGEHLALVRSTWKLYRPDNSVILGWRQHYTLRLTDQGPKIMLSALQSAAGAVKHLAAVG